MEQGRAENAGAGRALAGESCREEFFTARLDGLAAELFQAVDRIERRDERSINGRDTSGSDECADRTDGDTSRARDLTDRENFHRCGGS